MGDYLYKDADLSSTTQPLTKDIAKTMFNPTQLSDNVLIPKTIISEDDTATYYKNDSWDGYYVTNFKNVLSGKWGDIPHEAASYYKYKGNNVPFVKAISCPMFNDDSSLGFSVDMASWGESRIGPGTVYLSYNNPTNTSAGTGIWISYDNTTWYQKKSGHSLCFIDLVAGGGGGDIVLIGNENFAAGGGGGGGGYIRAALDLTKTGLVTIKIGAGGSGGTKTTYPTGTSDGENSTLTSTRGLSITCGGGKRGYLDEKSYAACGGAGGTVSGTTSVDATNGLLGISTQPGKAGGSGASIYINGYNSTIKSNAANSEAFGTETYTSFGLLRNNASIKSSYHGYAGSLYEYYTSAKGYQYTFGDIKLPNGLAGGGGGPSALGGSASSSSKTSGKGYGYGGTGAALGKKTNSTTYVNTEGTDGGDGVLIIHGINDSNGNDVSNHRLSI